MTKGKSTSGHGQLWCSRRAEAAVQQASQLRASTPGAGRAPAPAASWAQGAHGRMATCWDLTLSPLNNIHWSTRMNSRKNKTK